MTSCIYCHTPCVPEFLSEELPVEITCHKCQVKLIFFGALGTLAIFHREINGKECKISLSIGMKEADPNFEGPTADVVFGSRWEPPYQTVIYLPDQFTKTITPQNVIHKVRTFLTFS